MLRSHLLFFSFSLLCFASCKSNVTKVAGEGKTKVGIPDPFVITGPASLTNTPTIVWNEAAGAALYTVLLDDQNTCSSPLQSHDVTTTSKALTGLTDGTYYVCVTAKDSVGNARQATNNGYTFVFDGTPPTVTNVTSSTANGTHIYNAAISIQITFSEAATVTGTPQLKLATAGSVDRQVDYVSGSGTTVLTFNYTVQSGDISSDLDYFSTSALTLNGGTIKDAAGNNTVLTLATPGAAGSLGANKALVVDGAIPAVTNVTSTTANGAYKAAATVDVTVTFSDTVEVVGTPKLKLETGATDQIVDYTSGDGTATLTFTYTVQAGDTSSDLDYFNTSALTIVAASIQDASGNDASLTLPAPGAAGSLSYNKAIEIDTTVPVEPTLSTTDPVSPFSELRPKIKGTAEANSTVKIYNDSGCGVGNLVATGTAANFASAGLTVTSDVSTNASTTFYVKATDAALNDSACGTNNIIYRHGYPRLLKDIATSPPSTGYATVLCSLTIGGNFYYSGSEGVRTGIMKTDGTTAGTSLFKEVAAPSICTASGTNFFFKANSTGTGLELWFSDGTAAGTNLLKDIYPGVITSGISAITNIGGVAFFNASDGTNGNELWKSDGTTAGTVLVKDINAGSGNSAPAKFVNLGGTLIFTATDGAAGVELWKSDGTTAGTTIVKDINAGAGNSSPNNLIVIGSTVYFSATDGASGIELWKSDGTTAGTVLVKDINSGAGNSSPTALENINGTLFFAATDGAAGVELWKSDGTTVGTVLVKDINAGAGNSSPTQLFDVGGTAFFAASDGATGSELWKSDGTTVGTVLVKDIYSGATGSIGTSGNFTNVSGTLFFKATEGTNGVELWKSDGTTVGTVLVKDIYSGASNSLSATAQNQLVNLGGTLLFRADDGLSGNELWKSDGTTVGTVQVKDTFPANGPSSPGQLYNVSGSTFVFQATDPTNGFEPWVTDGTTGGTTLLKNINASTANSSPNYFTKLGSEWIFAANDGTNGTELWKTDGTTVGTVLVKDIYSGGSSSNPYSSGTGFVTIGATAYFQAYDLANGGELWKTDGTTAGTVLVKDVMAGAGSSGPSNFAVIGSTLYFSAMDASGTEMWKSDGTGAGTVMLKDIEAGAGSGSPVYFTSAGANIFFQATTAAEGSELWVSDGTTGGTTLVKDIEAGAGSSYPSSLTALGTNLIFYALETTTGYELWKSDGTSGGTVLLKDINPGTASSLPNNFTLLGSVLIFTADDGTSGTELWKTDGTTAGTVQIKDIYPGSTASSIGSFVTMGNFIYFSANDGTNGAELWRTDGTTAGTVMVYDSTANGGLILTNMARFGEYLIFSGMSNLYDREIFIF